MINNINTLQNLPQSAGLQTYTDVYLKQSLANLGQRYSVKGDGVQIGEFSIFEMFCREYDEELNKNSYVVAEVKADSVILSYFDNNADVNPIEALPIYGNSFYKTVEQVALPGTPIGNVVKYDEGGIIKKYDDEYATAFVGLNRNNEIEEIIIESSSINSDGNMHKLSDGIRFYWSKELNKVRALRIKLSDENHAIDNIYSIEVYNFATRNATLDSVYDILFDGIDPVITGHEATLSVESVINALIENGFVSLVETYEAMSGDNGNQHIHFDTNGQKPEYELMVNEFAYDVNEFIPFIESYYNSHVYFADSDNLALKRELLLAIFKKLFNDYCAASVYEEVESIHLYMPFNYKFVYSCNSNNPAYIYNSVKDISVEYTVDPIDEIYKITGDGIEQLIICDSTDTINIEDKFAVYQYQISYDKDNRVDDFNIERTYVLPYIDNNGYWCINDVTTSIYARGKDGGQPNMIMSYTDASMDNGYDVLTSLKRDEITNLDWQPVKYKVKPLDNNNNVGSNNYHVMMTYMPTNITSLNENLIIFLENAIILNINSVHSEVLTGDEASTNPTSLADDIDPDAVVPTFWVLQKTKNKETNGMTGEDDWVYEFSYIKQPGQDWAVDMNYLSNAEGIVKHYMNFGIEPDNYEHTWVVFDKVSTTFKNSTNDKNSTIWPVLKNFTREDFSEMLGSEAGISGQYTNDLNLMPVFFDNVIHAKGSGYISSVGQSLNANKYFTVGADHLVDNVINYKNYQNELVPNVHVKNDDSSTSVLPMLDLSEVFVRNHTVFNRTNILSVDKERHIYNAYIGVAFDSDNKAVLHIGTSNVNPNIGTMTLTDEVSKHNFAKHPTISIDFEQIILNGAVTMGAANWTPHTNVHGETIYTSSFVPATIGTLPKLTDANMRELTLNLLAYKDVVLFEGSDIAPSRRGNVSYLNVTRMVEEMKIVGFDASNTEFVTDEELSFDINDAQGKKHRILQLTTDITKSPQMTYKADGVSHSRANNMEVSYSVIPNGKMRVSVFETLSSASKPEYFQTAKI